MIDPFTVHVQRVTQAHNEAIERACAEALQTGDGVLVVRDPSEPETIHVGTSPLAPTQVVSEFPSMAALRKWLHGRTTTP